MTSRVLGVLLILSLVGGACKSEESEEGDLLASYASVAINSPAEALEERCPDLKCPLSNSFFDEVEFVPDAAGKIKAVVLRCPPPRGGVQASQEFFERARGIIQNNLGRGETFLASGDPTYWPARKRPLRVVTMTIDDSERTVVAIGPAGPDAEKIPPTGAANNREEVQKYWTKIAAIPAFAR